MFPTRSELLKKIELGEDTFLECKEVTFKGGNIREPKQDKLADEIAAFANTRGGVIVLGVRDRPRDVVGIPVERLDKVEALVRQACEDSMEPPGAPVIERMYLPDGMGEEKPIVRVEISRSLFVHSSPGGYFHRIGSSKRKIPTEQLFRLFQQRTQARIIRFDETPVSTASFDDLSEDLWKRFATPRTSDTQEQFLSKLGMASQDDNGNWLPTVAGVLLASRQPCQFLPNAFVQAVAYRGTEISAASERAYQLDAQDITGPLDQQIMEACQFVRKNMRVAARKNSGGRGDIPQYSMLAVFEAVANAVAHRDYSMSGSKIRLQLFNDRLELYTPGSLANTMTPESLEYRAASRNEAITSQLARCPVEHDDFAAHRTHIMDKRGEGVPVILSNSKQLSGRLPEYRMIDDSELLLTIYAASGS
ncbi:MAG: putative DNA binding domain-containing protein [Roseovarius sp.]|nr:putative DNA binding domain-containing protein [Roseovarius sp.]